jgi:hypothetical protein
MKKTTILVYILIIIIIATSAFSAENFVFGTYNPKISICTGQVFDDTIVVYNTGNYLSDYTFSSETTATLNSNFAKISTKSFSLYPGQSTNVTIRFYAPDNMIASDFTYDIYLLTALNNQKTLRYQITVNDCPISSFSDVNNSYDVLSCKNENVGFNLFNTENKTVKFQIKYSSVFGKKEQNITIAQNKSYAYTIPLNIPCNKTGTEKIDMYIKKDKVTKFKQIDLNILPFPYQKITTQKNSFKICGNDKTKIPFTIINSDVNNGHTLSVSLNKEARFVASIEDKEVTLNKDASQTYELLVNPVMPIDNTNITINTVDEKGATAKKEISLYFISEKNCEKINTTQIIQYMNITQETKSNIPIELFYPNYADYNQENTTYKISVSPSQSWITLSKKDITLSPNERSTIALSLNPYNSTIGRTYNVDVIITSELTKTKQTYYITIPKHNGEKFFTIDNLRYLFHEYKLFIIIGIILGLIIIFIIAMTSETKPKYRIIHKQGGVIKEIKKEIKKQQPVDEMIKQAKIEAEDDSEEEMKTLLGTIDVEKKAREKIITELTEWSKQYESVKKERADGQSLKLKRHEELDKECKEIGELLKVQKDSFKNLEKREVQIKRKIDKKKTGFFSQFFDFFKSDDKYIPLEEVNKKNRKTNNVESKKAEKEDSNKDKKKSFGQNFKEFFMDDEEE